MIWPGGSRGDVTAQSLLGQEGFLRSRCSWLEPQFEDFVTEGFDICQIWVDVDSWSMAKSSKLWKILYRILEALFLSLASILWPGLFLRSQWGGKGPTLRAPLGHEGSWCGWQVREIWRDLKLTLGDLSYDDLTKKQWDFMISWDRLWHDLTKKQLGFNLTTTHIFLKQYLTKKRLGFYQDTLEKNGLRSQESQDMYESYWTHSWSNLSPWIFAAVFVGPPGIPKSYWPRPLVVGTRMCRWIQAAQFFPFFGTNGVDL